MTLTVARRPPPQHSTDYYTASLLSPATFDEHDGDTIREHGCVASRSPSWSSAGGVMLSLAA